VWLSGQLNSIDLLGQSSTKLMALLICLSSSAALDHEHESADSAELSINLVHEVIEAH
jgi:hypothetical protein